MSKSKRPDTLTPKIETARILFYINSFIWFCLGTYLVLEMLYQNNGFSALLAGFFLYVNSGAMLVSAANLSERDAWVYYFSLIVLILNALVTRVSQFGLFDLITLLFDISIFIFLVSFGRAYLKKP